MNETSPKPQDLSYLEFVKYDLRVGTVTAAEAVPKSKKLLKLSVSFGPEIGVRTILAGIAEAYSPETINGLQVVAVLNLAPRAMMGIESHGMLLAGRSTTGQLILVNPNGIAEGGEIG
jgi:methionyl-tRNA synthetase